MINIILSLFTLNSLASLNADQVLMSVYNKDLGRYSKSEVEMRLLGDRSSKTREMIIYRRILKEKRSSLVQFTRPSRVRGVSLLTDQINDNTNQIIYLPALKNSKRISSGKIGGRFVKSDFYYEDLRDRNPKLDNNIFVDSAEFKIKTPCVAIKSTPRDKDTSFYGSRVSCIDPDKKLPIAVNFYDKNGQLLKTFKSKKIIKVEGIWTITESSMLEVLTQKYTDLSVKSITYKKNALSKIRFSRSDFK